MNHIFHKNALHSIILQLQVHYSKLNYQSSYTSVSYRATALKIWHDTEHQQAISARERALWELTVCFEFQSRSDRRTGHKISALQMVFRRKVTR